MYDSDCIETERLILRTLEDEDIYDVFALMSDDYICRMAGMPVMKTLERAQSFINYYRNGWAFGITEKGRDKVIGIVQIAPSWRKRRAELGYWLLEEYRGRGYMTEAVKAVSDILFDNCWCDEIRIGVYVGNEASERVAVKCGFHPEYDAYKEDVYSCYGTVESEEFFSKTAGDMEWERRRKGKAA